MIPFATGGPDSAHGKELGGRQARIQHNLGRSLSLPVAAANTTFGDCDSRNALSVLMPLMMSLCCRIAA